jgi:regulator of sigma E protease
MFDFLLNSDFLSAIIAFILILIPAVIIHEFGHFLAAKAVGITILEFGIGYPPRVAKLFRWGETEFTLNLLPLGGFVRPLGEDMIRTLGEEATQRDREELQARMELAKEGMSERDEVIARGVTAPKTVNEVGPWQRILFMAAGAIANIILAFVVFVIVGLLGIEQFAGARVVVSEMPENSALAAAGVNVGDGIEQVNGAYFESREDLVAALAQADGTVELTIIRGETGEIETVRVATASADTQVAGRLLITTLVEGAPAQAAGILPGDVVIGLNGESLANAKDPFEALQSINIANAGKTIAIDLLREGEQITLDVTPRLAPEQGQGYLGAAVQREYSYPGLGLTLIDFTPVTILQPLPFFDAVQYGWQEMTTVLRLIAELPGRLLSGQAQPEESRVISIVGISQLGGVFLQSSIETGNPSQILNFIALVSIALGITNLLPLPPLDGGRILFVVIEMLRGKPMAQRREEAIMMIGIVFLLTVGVFFIINDIRDPLVNLINR